MLIFGELEILEIIDRTGLMTGLPPFFSLLTYYYLVHTYILYISRTRTLRTYTLTIEQ